MLKGGNVKGPGMDYGKGKKTKKRKGGRHGYPGMK